MTTTQASKPIRHALELLPTHIRQERIKDSFSALDILSKRKRSRPPSYAYRSIFALTTKRNQRSIVKTSYARNTATRSWAAHGEYLQREHAQSVGEKGLGFNQNSDTLDLKLMLRQWQREGDEHVFKLIVSPENGHRLDLKHHAKALMQWMEKDLHTSLQWAAIDHYNTDHPHLHILVRGIDARGKTLIMERDYLSQGIRQHSEELATRSLGLRLDRDMVQARERQIEREYVTEIDRRLRQKAENSIVNYHTPLPTTLLSRETRLLEIKRLKFLETLGLAEKIDAKAWKLSETLELTLQQMQLSNDIIKSRARHNIRTFTHELPAPTEIHQHKPLTGKVVGMGLEEELKDHRYLLLEGIDGKVHYLQATPNIIKARDNFEFRNENIITLEKKRFVNEQGKTLPYIKVHNYKNLKELQRAPFSRLDQDVIEFVKDHGLKPQSHHPERSFAHEYAAAMAVRFEEFKKAAILIQEREHYHLARDWEKKLIRAVAERERLLKIERDHQLQLSQSNDNTLIKQQKLTLDNSGGQSKTHDRAREIIKNATQKI